jgi:hypothetical protein
MMFVSGDNMVGPSSVSESVKQEGELKIKRAISFNWNSVDRKWVLDAASVDGESNKIDNEILGGIEEDVEMLERIQEKNLQGASNTEAGPE